jgi:stromal membrane-associated protein
MARSPPAISELLALESNSLCADCKKKVAKWASTTLGIFICIDCSGIHRSLGTHISFVRSCTLDTWSPEQVRFMAAVGNRLANDYWESKIPDDFEFPDPTNTYQMSTFIRHKYVSKKWAADGAQPGSTPFQAPKPALVRRSSLQQAPRPASQTKVAPTQPAKRSISDTDLGVFFQPESPRRRRETAPVSSPTVPSPARKPGRQIPQRLARKMKPGTGLPGPKQPPPSAGSEPNLASFVSSDDDDPFA